ncbi:bacteriocin [Candidatus Poribacteria bacterium]|nr:bacteriocin [Candidatus Poribacteria bacterium]
MADYLARDDAPLSSEDWEKIDKLVVESARRRLVGRRFIGITGPLGAGATVVPKPSMGGFKEGEIAVKKRENITIPMIQKDFKLHWRDIESAKVYGIPLELGPAAGAAAYCAMQEDNMVFNGMEGYEGLLNAEGRTTAEVKDWQVTGNAFQNVVAGTEKLMSGGFYGPYAMVVSPSLYAKMHRVYEGTGVLEIAMVKELMTEGVFQSPAIEGDQAIIVATGKQNMDLVVGEDLTTAYLGAEDMDHPFRVFETVVLRIKRPGAICTFE